MDLIIFLIVLVFVFFFYGKFKSFIYAIGIIDLVLRLLNMIDMNIDWPSVNKFIEKYIPDSIVAIIDNNCNGIINTLAIWAYMICIGIFIYYVFNTFLKRK